MMNIIYIYCTVYIYIYIYTYIYINTHVDACVNQRLVLWGQVIWHRSPGEVESFMLFLFRIIWVYAQASEAPTHQPKPTLGNSSYMFIFRSGGDNLHIAGEFKPSTSIIHQKIPRSPSFSFPSSFDISRGPQIIPTPREKAIRPCATPVCSAT